MRTDLMHFLLGGVLVVAGCGAETKAPPPPAAGAGWTATEVRACEQLNVPECALVEPAGGRAPPRRNSAAPRSKS
jgi:hypothetical protein